MYMVRQISISMLVSLIILSFLLFNASLISMNVDQNSGNQQDLVAGSQYEIKQNYHFEESNSLDDYDPYIFINSVAERLKGIDKYIEKSLSVLTRDEHDDSIKARMKTIITVARLVRLDIGRIQFDIKNFFELIKNEGCSEEKSKFLLGALYGSHLIGKDRSAAASKPAEKPSVPAELQAPQQTAQKEAVAVTAQTATVAPQNKQESAKPEAKPASDNSPEKGHTKEFLEKHVYKGGCWHEKGCFCTFCKTGHW